MTGKLQLGQLSLSFHSCIEEMNFTYPTSRSKPLQLLWDIIILSITEKISSSISVFIIVIKLLSYTIE